MIQQINLNQLVKDSVAYYCDDLADKIKLPNVGNTIQEANVYFKHLLQQAPIKTRDEEDCLLDDLDTRSWISYFQEHVVPTLIRFNLFPLE